MTVAMNRAPMEVEVRAPKIIRVPLGGIIGASRLDAVMVPRDTVSE